MPEVLEINTIEQLAPYRAAWHALLEATPRASFFQSLEWLEAYWTHFGNDKRLRVVLVVDGSRITGIVPLAVVAEPTWLGTMRVLGYPLDDWGSFYGPIGGKPYESLAVALAHVKRSPRDWDYLELRWCSLGDACANITAEAMRQAGVRPVASRWNETAFIDFRGDWQSYLGQRPRKWRSNLRRAERLLAETGEISYLRYRPPGEVGGEGDPRWDLYDACEEIARRSWQGDSCHGTTLSHSQVRPFLRDAHQAAVRLGMVDLNLLLVGGRPAAFVYNYHYRGSLYGLRLGFDAEVSRQGAGHVLFGRLLADSFARGDIAFDLGVDYPEPKRYLLTRAAPILRYSHYRLLPRAQILRLKRWISRRGIGSRPAV